MILGTSVKITTVLSVNDPDGIVISIEDSNNVLKVDEVSMTKEADNVYSYVWQSSVDDTAGDYIVVIKVTDSGKVSYSEDTFNMVENPLED